MRSWGPWALVATVALGLAACAVNPVTRRPELSVVSQATELELGRTQARTIEQEMGLVAEGPLTAYLRHVGERLAASSPRRDVPYAFHLVDLAEPNAFAVPGHVYVTRGLLVLMNDEDELAGVLAHEIGHIAARHAVQRLSRALPAGVVTGLVSGVTGLASPLLGDLVRAGGSLATDALLAPYSREQEREADRVGQEIMARAGADPAAVARALATLERAEMLEEGHRRPSFLDSHPTTPERARTTATYAGELPVAPRAETAVDPAAFLGRLDGLVVGPGAAHGVFVGPTFLHPAFGFHLRFPAPWKTDNARTHVAGAAADGALGLVATLAAAGDDPMQGVQAFEKAVQQPLGPRVTRTTIGGRPAARFGASAESGGRRAVVEIWWVALGGRVFQLTGIAPERTAAEHRPVLAAVAESFGPLTADERAQIREQRLRVVPARAGETVAGLAARTRTSWRIEEVAIANALTSGAVLTAGRPIKVASLEPYP